MQGLILSVILLFLSPCLFADPLPSVYAASPIQEECHSFYVRGEEVFREAVTKNILEKGEAEFADFMNEALNATNAKDDCRFAFSMGAFDAQGVFHQTLILERLLEQNEAIESGKSKEAIAALNAQFKTRFAAARIPEEKAATLSLDTELGKKTFTTFVRSMNQIADTEKRAVPFGRFTFLGESFKHPYTIFENVVNEKGESIQIAGTYQQLAERIWNRTRELAEAYLQWRPGTYYGEDSFLYGVFWRKSNEKSVREIKEEHFDRAITQMLRFASSARLNMKPFFELEQLRLKKKGVSLQQEIHALDRAIIGVWAAPLVPIGMYVGTMAIGYSVANLTHTTAANIAALFSLGPIAAYAGIGVNNAAQDYLQSTKENPFRFIDAMDRIVGATITSFPLAAITPVALGGTGAVGKVVVTGVKELLAGGVGLVQSIQRLGMKGTITQIQNLPRNVVQSWVSAWWNNKLLVVDYIADVVVTTGFEIGWRQLHLTGKQKFYYVDENGVGHFNEQVLITLGTSAVMGAISKPIVLLPTATLRFLTYRAFGVASGVISHLVITGAINKDRLIFDQAYSIGVSTPVAESLRAIKLSSLVADLPTSKQFALFLALTTATKFALTPLRVFLQDSFLDGKTVPIEQFRKLFEVETGLDISDYSDENLLSAIKRLEKDVL